MRTIHQYIPLGWCSFNFVDKLCESNFESSLGQAWQFSSFPLGIFLGLQRGEVSGAGSGSDGGIFLGEVKSLARLFLAFLGLERDFRRVGVFEVFLEADLVSLEHGTSSSSAGSLFSEIVINNENNSTKNRGFIKYITFTGWFWRTSEIAVKIHLTSYVLFPAWEI